jgi:hypothetical protein
MLIIFFGVIFSRAQKKSNQWGSLHVDRLLIPCGTCGQSMDNEKHVIHAPTTLINNLTTIALIGYTLPKIAYGPIAIRYLFLFKNLKWSYAPNPTLGAVI